jgi:hypothetical protein
MTKTFPRALLVSALALSLAACSAAHPWTIKNPFGGAPLVLTGNLGNDMPSINAYNATLQAGVKADVTELQGYFTTLCPYVAQAQAALPNALPVAQQALGTTAGQKQISNATQALTVAQNFCAVGTASNLQAAFTAAVQAVNFIRGLIG